MGAPAPDPGPLLNRSRFKLLQGLLGLTSLMRSGEVFHLHARFIKTFHRLVFRDLLLLSCACRSSLSYITAIFHSHSTIITDTFPYNIMIRAHSLHPTTSPHSISVFALMHRNSIRFDTYTFPFLLKACAHHPSRRVGLNIGITSHGLIVKSGLFSDSVHVGNGVLGLYGAFGFMNFAVKVFDEMPKRDVVSWASVIAGFGDNGSGWDAVFVFRMMQVCGDVEVDAVTMISVATAVASLGVPELALWVYSFLRRMGKKINTTVALGTAMVVMMSKCGYINIARKLFDDMPKRNLQTWTALIVGLAEHGRSREAVDVYEMMETEGALLPDHVTFIGVLTACSHGGLVDDGMRLFRSIKEKYCMVPAMEHYGCVVDLLGRAGKVEEAFKFIENMHLKPSVVIWRTLLGGCVRHGMMGLAETVKKRIVELESDHHGDYVLLSNVYGGSGRWSEKERVMLQMKDQGVVNRPGWSAVFS